MRLSLMHKGFLLVSIPLCFELGIFSLLINQQNEMAAETARINKSRDISNAVNMVTKQAINLEDAFKSNNNPFSAAATIRDGTADLIVQFNRLELMTKSDQHLHQIVLDSLVQLHAMQVDFAALKQQLLSGEVTDPSEAAHRFGPNLHKRIRNVISLGLLELASQSARTIDTDRTEAMRGRTVLLLKIAVAISATIALLSAWLFSRHLTSRLSVVVDNADRLGERQTLLAPLAGNDEIAELDNAVHQAAELISHLEQTREEIIGMVSHDIRSPLATIKVAGEALEMRFESQLDERGRQLFAEIESNCERVLRISQDLLDMQKLESGMLNVEKSAGDLRQCIQSAVSATAGMCHHRGVEVIVVAPSVPAVFDEGRIEQVITNLLTNAIKHSPRNGTVDVTLQVENRGKRARISVCDKGKGVPEHLHQAIFERFKQADKDEYSQGTGLGLAISKALVEMHGGQIGVDNLSPTGSEFFIVLPI